MKTIKARAHDDDVVTEDVRSRAVARGRQRQKSVPCATSVCYVPDFAALAVRFSDDAAIMFPVKRYVEFASLSEMDLRRVEIGYAGSALCLMSHDLHVSIAGLVAASVPLMELAAAVIAARNGSRSSPTKALAARENGKKGGRPRKALLASL